MDTPKSNHLVNIAHLTLNIDQRLLEGVYPTATTIVPISIYNLEDAAAGILTLSKS
jgi:hypothetical protein